jgi:GAF domain-containing protein
VLSDLLTKLMQIVLEMPGRAGALLLDTNGQLVIEVSGTVGDDRIAVQRGDLEPRSDRDDGTPSPLPLSVINYVARTRTALVLNDATAEDLFATDPYISLSNPNLFCVLPSCTRGN